MPISGISGYRTVTEYQENYLKPIQQGREGDVKSPKQVELEEELKKSPKELEKEKKEHETVAEKRANCETCKNRKYQDGSNESDVSFKAPTHVSPEASTGAVLSHELEHVSNARAEGSKEGNELVSVSVAIHYERCPECGRVYAAGGVTHSVMKKSEPNYGSTGYGAAQKAQDYTAIVGNGVDNKL